MFLLKAFNEPNYLEDLTGLSKLQADTADDEASSSFGSYFGLKNNAKKQLVEWTNRRKRKVRERYLEQNKFVPKDQNVCGNFYFSRHILMDL